MKPDCDECICQDCSRRFCGCGFNPCYRCTEVMERCEKGTLPTAEDALAKGRRSE